MTNLLSLFSKSPFEPLYEHRLRVMACVQQVRPLFEALFAGDTMEFQRIAKLISDKEKEADRLKMEIRRLLPKGIFLSVNREDLLRYLKIQDDIADTVEDVMVLLRMKELSAPPELAVDILAFIDTVLTVCHLDEQATDHLRSLVESGFKGEEVKLVVELVEKSEAAERIADDAGFELARKLFTFEDKMKTTDLFLWFRIFDLIGDLADFADNTGEWLRNMLSR